MKSLLLLLVGTGLCPASLLHIVQYSRAWLCVSVTVLGPSLVLCFSGGGCIAMGNLRFLPSNIVEQACWAAASCSWWRCAQLPLVRAERAVLLSSQEKRPDGAWSARDPCVSSAPSGLSLAQGTSESVCACTFLLLPPALCCLLQARKGGESDWFSVTTSCLLDRALGQVTLSKGDVTSQVFRWSRQDDRDDWGKGSWSPDTRVCRLLAACEPRV